MNEPPEHVCAAFGLAGIVGQPLGPRSGRVWRYGDAVIKASIDAVESAWGAGVIDTVRVSGIRVPRPVRSLDGRWVVGGWCAQRFVSGRPAARFADMVEASLVFGQALREVRKPKFLSERRGIVGWADRLAWGERTDGSPDLGLGRGAEVWRDLAGRIEPITLESQIIHGDLFGNVLFAGSAPPAVVGFSPLWRPAAYAGAIVAVDSVAWGGAPTELLDQWSYLPAWPGLLARAALFRLALGLRHPRSTVASIDGIVAVAAHLGDTAIQ